MGSVHVVELPGCTPEPLMSYLKALGVLRLVSEQADPQALGHWSQYRFVLESKLSQDELVDFFLNKYSPTPIIAPWGARSGFFPGASEKKARSALGKIIDSSDQRFDRFKIAVREVQKLLKKSGHTSKPTDENKLRLMRTCRAFLPDDTLDWIDACYVLTETGRRFPPIFGTGGNEGSGSYVSGFAQQVGSCLIDRACDGSLKTSLFAAICPDISHEQTPGHFSPQASGGPNSSQGMSGPVSTNQWDYILCIEGACVWAAGVVRRLGQQNSQVASYPFTFEVSGVGGSLSDRDAQKPKQAKRDIAEIWLPLWANPTSYNEVNKIFIEGRGSIGRRSAQTGTDMARSIAELGVDRGIQGFQRLTFLMRNGQSFMAVNQGRFHVKARSEAHLLYEIDPRLQSLRKFAQTGKLPQRLSSAFHRVDTAIMNFCRYGGTLCDTLVALGAVERALAVTEGRVSSRKEPICRPFPVLSSRWIQATHDGSPEFEVALALASLHHPKKSIQPVRANLEPVNQKGDFWSWGEAGRSVVWKRGSLVENMIVVLERRLLDGRDNASIDFHRGVRTETLADFVAGKTDDRRIDDGRIEELLWALMLVQTPKRDDVPFKPSKSAHLFPRAFALLKPLFLPRPIRFCANRWQYAEPESDAAIPIRPEHRILPLVRAGRIREACGIAARRLRVTGLNPLPSPAASGFMRQIDAEIERTLDPARLAASLLLPIRGDELNRLLRLVTRLPEEDASVHQTEEGE